MKITIKNTLLTVLLSLQFITAFGQTKKDKIIFLTDFYETFIQNVKTSNKSVDSIYKENIQNSICNKHFKKSEYAFIVNDFFALPIKNTAELTKSIHRITTNKETINTKITGALKKSRQNITNDSLTIYIIPVNPDNKAVITEMNGIMGLTAGSKQIILTIEPDVAGWENMLEYAVAHEFNHACWTNINFGKSAKWTLLDYLVFEGRGDYFAHLLYPNVIAPWTIALTESQKSELWNKIKPNLESEDINYHVEVMFGSKQYPVWGGYALGYEIVSTALTGNEKIKPDDWTNLSSDKILSKSKYR